MCDFYRSVAFSSENFGELANKKLGPQIKAQSEHFYPYINWSMLL